MKGINQQLASLIGGLVCVGISLGAVAYLYLVVSKQAPSGVVQAEAIPSPTVYSINTVAGELTKPDNIYGKAEQLNQPANTTPVVQYLPQELGKTNISSYE